MHQMVSFFGAPVCTKTFQTQITKIKSENLFFGDFDIHFENSEKILVNRMQSVFGS